MQTLQAFFRKLFLIITSTHALAFLSGAVFLIFLNIDYEIFFNGLHRWQELTAGLLALFAAIATIFIMDRHRKDDIFKQKLKAKAYMRDALAELSDYAEKCVHIVTKDLFIIPDRPTEAINVFKDFIGYIDSETVKTLDELTLLYQIYNSRLDTYIHSGKPAAREINKIQHLYEWILFQAILNRVFYYARGECSFLNYIESKYFSQRELLSAFRSLTSNRKMGIAYSVPTLHTAVEKYITDKHDAAT